MTSAQQGAYVDHQGEIELVRDSDGLWLELHTAIVPNYYSAGRPADELWDRIERVGLGRGEVWGLAPGDELEALCVHGSKHRWERLMWIVDIGKMAGIIPENGWAAILARARAHGTLRMVHLGLLLAAELTGAVLPGTVLSAAQADRQSARLVNAVKRELFNPRQHRSDALFFHVRMRERPADRVRYLFNVMFRPSGADWEALAMPRALFPVYAVTRPIRLSVKYGRRLIRRS